MQILKFLNKAFATKGAYNFRSTQGLYWHCVGHHTKKFCSTAARTAKTPDQKRIWFTSAISADEVIAALAGLEKRRPLGSLAAWQLRPGLDGNSYLTAIKIYLSGLLLLYGNRKEELLALLELTEQEFMESWQSVFDYSTQDKAIYDEKLFPALRGRGIDGLVNEVCELIKDTLFMPESPCGEEERSSLGDLMISDRAAVERYIEKRKGKPF